MVRAPATVRFLLPVVASGLLSFALCAVMAVFLYREQDTSAAALQENIKSHRAAADLEQNLADLVAVLKDRGDRVAALNDRIDGHLQAVRTLADHPAEVALVDHVTDSFRRYRALWAGDPSASTPDERADASLRIVEGETLKACQELREYNARRIDTANEEHRVALRQLSWGLAAVGGSAGLAGVFLGYGVARGLSRSIQRLQVRVQDAAGKLGRDLPAVELAGGGHLDQLDRQVLDLVGRIEAVVERLHQREREVRRAEQLAALGQLAAGMAHEFRNPLTSIKMLVQAAREEHGGLPADDLAVIEREIRRVEQSLQTFLDYARPPRPAKAPTDLAGVVRETLELTRGRAGKQRVAVRFEPPFQQLTVDADPAQIRQVLVNLVLNALDAMPGGGTLSVELRADGPAAEVAVRDTGPGISPDIRPRLFQPFASTRDTGLGLGLVISRRIAEDHGGTVTADNPPGGGARLTVRLPRLNAPPSPPP